jgi:hypothetical protein
MIELTTEQTNEISRHSDMPVRAIDPDTRNIYVLLPEELYDRVRLLLFEEEDSQLLRAAYSHGMEVFGRAGWDDPEMDIYDDLDPRRQA